MSLFNSIRGQWLGGSKKIVYRLYCRTPSTYSGCGGGLARKYIVQWAYHDRETGTNSEWHDWDSSGKPEHSPDAFVTQVYGSGSINDGKFPVWCCEPAGNDEHIGNVLGYNSPNYEADAGAINAQRVIIVPEWDLVKGPVGELIVAGDMTQAQINDWSNHWGMKGLERFLTVFGATRPNPTQSPTYATRAVYCALHHTLTYQAVTLISGALNWSNSDNGEPPRHPLGTSTVGQIFGGTGVDLPPGFQPFQCTTVVGIHFSPTAATLANYSYGNFGHLKMTGSVDFEQRGCNADPCGDPTGGSLQLGQCDFIPATESGIAIGDERNRPSLILDGVNITNLIGYNTPPEDGTAYVQGSDGAHLDNEIWRNYWIQRVAYQLCQINNSLLQMGYDVKVGLGNIVTALNAQQLNIDTTAIETKLDDIKTQIQQGNTNFVDAFKIVP